MSTDSWELSEELRVIRDTARRFMQSEVKPLEDKLPHDAYEFPAETLKSLQRKARDIGLWCVRTPTEYGGALPVNTSGGLLSETGMPGMQLIMEGVRQMRSIMCAHRTGAPVPSAAVHRRKNTDGLGLEVTRKLA